MGRSRRSILGKRTASFWVVTTNSAFRFLLPGDGECEAWLFADGSPAGFTFRDPLRRAKVEWHVREQNLRVVVDGKLEPAWSSGNRSTGQADEAWFRRT